MEVFIHKRHRAYICANQLQAAYHGVIVSDTSSQIWNRSWVYRRKSVWLAQLLKSLAAPKHVHLGGPGSIPGADNLDLGFHLFWVGKMSSSKYVAG